ncbi:winged helix DNA-binding protein [Roseibium sp. RKSG952]|uniref:winged helix DNA-binding protein n=1 Tax=Roseibium sp. RKSG952 TaxID=2529384 RepID=UPI001FCA9396|nr:winged helix DNA-binding protein [Roseibium sp. RKSG952]
MRTEEARENLSDIAVAMDRSLRVFADFVKPILRRHKATDLSFGNLMFLISVGEGDARVKDLVQKGRHVGSNASYALKALEKGGYIKRWMDESDRRNALVSWTPKAIDVVTDIKTAASPARPSGLDLRKAFAAFESHCARVPE